MEDTCFHGGAFDSGDYYIRPIVTIPSDVIIYGGDGSQEHPYELSK